MIPPSTTPTIGEARAHQGGHGYGLVLFASILLVVIGCFNLIYGIAAIANSHVFTANAHYVFGNLRAWGWITLIIGVLQLLAAAGAVSRRHRARWDRTGARARFSAPEPDPPGRNGARGQARPLAPG